MKRLTVLVLLVVSVAFAQDMQLVTRVIDGDTVELESGERVRLLGIDTPETQGQSDWYGREASRFVEDLLTGQYVRLEYDCIAGRYDDTGPPNDKGRLLAYIYLPDGDEELFINLLLVEGGYAFAYKYNKYPLLDEMEELFLAAEREAIISRRGLWKSPEWITSEIAYKTEEQLYGIFDDSGYWLNRNRGTRHNDSCDHYENTTNGRHCGQYEGKACGYCGG